MNKQHVYLNKLAKSHISCKTCHVKLVTVCEYEQNPSRNVGEVAHTRFQDIRRSANLNAHPQITDNGKWKADVLFHFGHVLTS